MTGDSRHGRMDAARVRAELTVHGLWLRYLALGGTGDAFELDGYLQGLVPLEPFQQDILAQALNEGLDDLYQAHHIPLAAPEPKGVDDDRLLGIVEKLLGDWPPSPTPPPPRGAGPA